MRNEEAIRNYLDTCLVFLKNHPTIRFYKPALSSPSSPSSSANTNSPQGPMSLNVPSPVIRSSSSSGETAIGHIVIVRKLTELHGLIKKRREVLHELETAHVQLARAVMSAVAVRVREQSKARTPKEKIKAMLPSRRSTREGTALKQETIDVLVETLGCYLPKGSRELYLWQASSKEKSLDPGKKTIWEALADLPQETLDAYQPVTKLKFFRGQIAPSIDLYVTKLNLLTVSFPVDILIFGGHRLISTFFLDRR